MKITVSVLWLSMKSNVTKNLTAFHQISFYRPIYLSILTYTLILITSLQNYSVHETFILQHVYLCSFLAKQISGMNSKNRKKKNNDMIIRYPEQIKCHTNARFIKNDYLTLLFITLNVQDIYIYLFCDFIFLNHECPCGVNVLAIRK